MVQEARASSPPPWPRSVEELERVQIELAVASDRRRRAEPPPATCRRIAGCFVCFGRGGGGIGAAGDRGWAGAACHVDGEEVATATVPGEAAAAYDPSHLALREGPLLEAALRALGEKSDLLLVNATGRDHPRRAGLALHLGARLDIPSIGITNRLLVASGTWPADVAWAQSPLHLAGEIVGFWVRVRKGVRPVAVHAGWGMDPDTAVAWVRTSIRRARTPEPLRAARRLAREAREQATRGDSPASGLEGEPRR